MPVVSSLVQGSEVGPVLFTIFIDTLLQLIPFSSAALNDNDKFAADADISSAEEIQRLLYDWHRRAIVN